MLACYFPITYAPPANPGPDIITREQLVAGVAAALAAVPAFAPYTLPLVLEKLGSSLRCGWVQCKHLQIDWLASACMASCETCSFNSMPPCTLSWNWLGIVHQATRRT